jgi:thioredoxin reductase (NADPH)
MEPAMSNDSSGNPGELSSGGSRYHQVYPTLSERQLAILERYGERRKLKAHDILYSEGDRHIGMFAILSGTIEGT